MEVGSSSLNNTGVLTPDQTERGRIVIFYNHYLSQLSNKSLSKEELEKIKDAIDNFLNTCKTESVERASLESLRGRVVFEQKNYVSGIKSFQDALDTMLFSEAPDQYILPVYTQLIASYEALSMRVIALHFADLILEINPNHAYAKGYCEKVFNENLKSPTTLEISITHEEAKEMVNQAISTEEFNQAQLKCREGLRGAEGRQDLLYRAKFFLLSGKMKMKQLEFDEAAHYFFLAATTAKQWQRNTEEFNLESHTEITRLPIKSEEMEKIVEKAKAHIEDMKHFANDWKKE